MIVNDEDELVVSVITCAHEEGKCLSSVRACCENS